MLLLAALVVASCSGRREALLPTVSGKAGEVIVVMDKTGWEGALGTATRDVLAADCPFLPTKEPLYSLINVNPAGFTDLFKVHRNIVLFNISAQVAEPGFIYQKDMWAAPQCVLQISAHDGAEALAIFEENSAKIVAALEQAERDRVISNCKRFEEKSIAPVVRETFGGSPHFPSGYKLLKKTEDFFWIQDEKQYTTQGVFVYKYSAKGDESDFSLANIVAHRNAALKENVPGMFENTYMTTGDLPYPTTEFLKFRGRSFAQTRGWWEVVNDYMGGPFVSHSFYSKDGSEIIVCDAFVYAPKYDKRLYLRQVESIIYSWEWKVDEEIAK